MNHHASYIGKIRGLSATSTPGGVFCILAFDHRQSFVKMMDPTGNQPPVFEEVVKAKSEVVRVLAPHASGVLLDPVYGAAQLIANQVLPTGSGLMVALEESGYEGNPNSRSSSILAGWSVSKAKRMGADAIKLLVYYHPDAGEMSETLEYLIRKVVQECRQADITLFLEPVSYSIDPKMEKDSRGFAEIRPQLIARTAERLGSLGPDVLKLEFPVDAQYERKETHWAAACEAVSTASPCPWTVLSAGIAFDLFAKQVEIACRHGASGYIAGRALWKDGIPLPTPNRLDWLEKVAAPRMDQLANIATRFARPWTDFYPNLPASAPEGWYLTYQS
jgi:tagatose-1,6-bisphosphate aldolase